MLYNIPDTNNISLKKTWQKLTRKNLLEGAAEPDVIQAAGALWWAGADVGELVGWHQGTEFLFS